MQIARRGQALVETAVFLPLFLFLLFGIIWVVQTSVVNERLQLAVRYSGLISNEASPYSAWSLYALYEDTEYTGSTTSTRTCYAPAPGVLSNSNPFPGPTSAPFWQPASVGAPNCTPYNNIGADNLSIPAVLNDSDATISATTNVPNYLSLGVTPNLTAEQKFFGAPDLLSMLGCFTDLDGDVMNSLEGTGGGSSAPAALPSLPGSTPSLTTSC